MNIPNNLKKSILLATCVFWLIAFTEEFNFYLILLVFLSMIPIAICCSIVIIFTIVPFFLISEGRKLNKKMVFKLYFPFYSLIAFTICIYGIANTNFALYSIAFFTSAFVITSQSWVWFSQEKE